MREAATYVERMPRNPELELRVSLWSRSWQEPLRHFHVPVFGSVGAMEAAFEARETREFADPFYEHVGSDGVEHIRCETVLSDRGRRVGHTPRRARPHVRGGRLHVRLGRGARKGMEAAARYVSEMRNRPEVLLSLWSREIANPARHFHVHLCGTTQPPARHASGRRRTRSRALFPHLDVASVEQTFTDVVLSNQGHLDPEGP